MSFRPGSRIFSSFRPFFQRANARRRVNTAAGAEPAGFQKFWNSPIGPKTVHFWYASTQCFSKCCNAYFKRRFLVHTFPAMSEPSRAQLYQLEHAPAERTLYISANMN